MRRKRKNKIGKAKHSYSSLIFLSEREKEKDIRDLPNTAYYRITRLKIILNKGEKTFKAIPFLRQKIIYISFHSFFKKSSPGNMLY